MKNLLKIKFSKNLISFLLLITLFVIIPSQNKVKACAWGECISAQIYKQTMENIERQIQGAILGALKTAAAEVINETVNILISGSGSNGGPLFITDWEDYLYKQPQKNTEVWMNDFFTIITRGTASSANYKSFGEEGVIGSYAGKLVKNAQLATTEATFPAYDLNQYVSDPSQIFKSGNWRAFMSYVSNPANNSFGMTLLSQDAYMSKLELEKQIASDKAKAYSGFKAVEESGKVITPGSTIQDIQSQTQDLGNKIIAGATNIPEVITATVTKLTAETIKQGIGKARVNIQRNIETNIQNHQLNIQKEIENKGPGSIFKSSY